MSENKVMPENLLELKEGLECPVCLQLPQQTPIYQCENGHIVCKNCHQKLVNCPQCRRPLGKNRNLFAENFLVYFMKPCPFSKHGCQQKFLPDMAKGHQKSCRYREIVCFVPFCKQRISVNLIKKHLEITHEQIYNTSSTMGSYKGRLQFHEASSEIETRNSPTFISFLGQEFIVMKLTGLSDLRHFWVYGPGTRNEMSKLNFTIQFKSNDGKVKLSVQDQVVSVETQVLDVISDGDGITLTDEATRKLTKSGLVILDVKIFES